MNSFAGSRPNARGKEICRLLPVGGGLVMDIMQAKRGKVTWKLNPRKDVKANSISSR